MAKRFLCVCLGVLALAIAYHLAIGPGLATSQEGERPVLMAGGDGYVYVMTDQGKLYYFAGGPQWWELPEGQWPGTPPTATQPTTWGSIKSQFGK